MKFFDNRECSVEDMPTGAPVGTVSAEVVVETPAALHNKPESSNPVLFADGALL
jgi:hypothetical protein